MILAGAVTAVMAVPLLVEGTPWSFVTRILGIVGVYIILALGVNMVLGYVGLLDLGYMAFYALGAYTTALLSLKGWSFWAALPAAVAMTMAVRLALGAPLLRLRGDYLAIVTLGFGEITRIALNNWDTVTNGPKGLSLLSSPDVKPVAVFGFELATNLHYFYLIAAFAAAGVVVSYRLNRSRIGRAWIAIRENEVAARAMGIPVARMKTLAFTLSAGAAAAAGAIFARWENFVTPESFTFWESVLIVCMVVLGGMGSVRGVVLGAALIVGVPEILRSDVLFRVTGVSLVNYRYLIFGALLVVMAVFRPQGMIPRKEGLSHGG